MISVSVARHYVFKVIIDCEKEDLRTGKTKLVYENTGKVVMTGVEKNVGLYEGMVKTCTAEAAITGENRNVLWHSRLGHCGFETMKVTIPHARGIEKELE